MKRKMLLLFIALVLLTLPGLCCPAACEVRGRGDTLWIIARRFNTSVGRILELNPGIRPNHLVIGQRIAVKEANQDYIYHTVKKGRDSLDDRRDVQSQAGRCTGCQSCGLHCHPHRWSAFAHSNLWAER